MSSEYPASGVNIVVVSTDEQFEKAKHIRVEVFVHEQGFSLEDEFDGRDDRSIHLLAMTSEGAIGTIRFDVDTSRLGRLAVLRPSRGIGAGKALVQALERVLEASGADLKTFGGSGAPRSNKWRIECHSQMHAIPFYRRLGYVEAGDVFEEDGAPHQSMFKTVQCS